MVVRTKTSVLGRSKELLLVDENDRSVQLFSPLKRSAEDTSFHSKGFGPPRASLRTLALKMTSGTGWPSAIGMVRDGVSSGDAVRLKTASKCGCYPACCSSLLSHCFAAAARQPAGEALLAAGPAVLQHFSTTDYSTFSATALLLNSTAGIRSSLLLIALSGGRRDSGFPTHKVLLKLKKYIKHSYILKNSRFSNL